MARYRRVGRLEKLRRRGQARLPSLP